jgi:hypothetical protein
MIIYSVQKPDDQDNGTFCGTYDECLNYIKAEHADTIDEDNERAEYHGWQIIKLDEDTDTCFAEYPITSADF